MVCSVSIRISFMRIAILVALTLLVAPAWAGLPFCGIAPGSMVEASPKLMKAATEGNIAGMWKAIGNCANPNYQDKDGVPILGAVFKAKPKNMLAVVKLLASIGADVNARIYILPISFDLVGSPDCDPQVLDVLFKHGLNPNDTGPIAGMNALEAALLDGDSNSVCISSLIEHGSYVNFVDQDGDTPLSMAANRGDPDIVKLLLENGAQPNTSNKLGLTPLMNAAGTKHAGVAKVLLQYGANPCLMNEDGYRASDIAKMMGDGKLAELLECHRRNPKTTAPTNRTLL